MLVDWQLLTHRMSGALRPQVLHKVLAIVPRHCPLRHQYRHEEGYSAYGLRSVAHKKSGYILTIFFRMMGLHHGLPDQRQRHTQQALHPDKCPAHHPSDWYHPWVWCICHPLAQHRPHHLLIWMTITLRKLQNMSTDLWRKGRPRHRNGSRRKTSCGSRFELTSNTTKIWWVDWISFRIFLSRFRPMLENCLRRSLESIKTRISYRGRWCPLRKCSRFQRI